MRVSLLVYSEHQSEQVPNLVSAINSSLAVARSLIRSTFFRMEPRPQKSNRTTGPFINTGNPSPGSAPNTGGFGQPAFDASSAPPAPPPAIGYDPDYSPGQPLTPLRGPRGANIVGPLLAVAALAIIVAAVAFIVSQFRSGDDSTGHTPTAVVAAIGSPTDSLSGGQNPKKTSTPADDNRPTDESGGDSKPTSTPRVARPTSEGEDLSATDEPTGSDDQPLARTKASQWFPKEADVGDGYKRADNGTRTGDEVAASFPDPEDATVQIDGFGWVENAYRQYELDSGATTDTQVINVSVHRFKTEQGASDALAYFANGGQTAQNLEEVSNADTIGDESISLQGAIEGGNIYVVYFRKDDFLIRVGGLSTAGDPADKTVEVSNFIAGEGN